MYMFNKGFLNLIYKVRGECLFSNKLNLCKCVLWFFIVYF